MNKLIASLKWVDTNLLKILLVVFLFFIPLYPKLPLQHVEYTYISVRLEDLFVAFLGLVYAIQLLRRKETLNKRFFIIFVLFWGAVFLSYAFGFFVMKTVLYKQVGLLHSLRRIEYMSLFFMGLSTIKSKKDLYIYGYLLTIVLGIVCVYGIGQKYLGWPAVQTMNPAFAQGMILYLTPEARVSSTFAGHYDLAAYLVFFIPITIGLFYHKKNWFPLIVFILSIFVLTLTASRISFIAYIVSVGAFLIFTRKFKFLLVVILVTAACSFASSNLVNRFLKTVQVKQIFVNRSTGQVVVPQKISSKELPAGTTFIEINKPVDEKSEERNKQLVQEEILESVRKDASRSGKLLTASEEAALVATLSARLQPVNTVVTDISASNRYNAEWPRAINAFKKNPILGTGPSSITEATDNDYLRSIGEFGLLGTGLFVYIFFTISQMIFKKAHTSPKNESIFYYSFLFGLLGLLINATYIDVFEASKVAFIFWLVAGAYIGSILIEKHEKAV